MNTRVRALVVTLLCASASLLSVGARCEAVVLLTRSDGVSVRFSAELALTPDARRTGLMYRRVLPPRSGMWFDFQREAPVVMWMKNTLVPLDMLFITAAGRVVSIAADATPLSLARLGTPEPVRYVFEINAGEAARYAIARGDRVLLVPCQAGH